MIDIPWKVFSQTGNIEAYLWMKGVETEDDYVYHNEASHSIFEDTHN